MKTKKFTFFNLCLRAVSFISLLAVAVTLHAQSGFSPRSSQSFTQKIDISNVGNGNDTYYLLLCRLLPNATSNISGVITIESAAQDTLNFAVHFSNDTLSYDNEKSNSSQGNVATANIIIVQYEGEEYTAVGLVGIMNIANIKFTGYAENKSLLLVYESEVVAANNPNVDFRRSTDPFTQNNVETNLENFQVFNGQWRANQPINNTLGSNAYQGINFGYDANNYVSLVNGAGQNNLFFGRWSFEWKGWSKIWHSNNLNRIDVDFCAKTLVVAGTITAREVIVDANAGADFVFSPSYPLRPLSEVEQFITANNHLPDIAPADTMIQNGVNMGEMQMQLLQKIEELTLYIIEQQKQIDALNQELGIRNQKFGIKNEE